MKFKAAMFDFDGTLTEKGQYTPPQKLADALVNLSQKIPIGFCTGRQLESFEHRALAELMKEVDEHERQRFLENLFLFAENGAIGYIFDQKPGNFKEFYRVEWPEKFLKKIKLKRLINEKIADLGEVYENAHRIVIVMRTRLHDAMEREVAEVYRLSGEIYEICLRLLRELAPDYERFLHVGNSGIGVIIGPAEGDKDHAIKEFGAFLRKKRRVKLGPRLREILVVGDSPQVGGNDHYFLKGDYGTPYTVGEKIYRNSKLREVFDVKGKKLRHARGSLELLKRLFFASVKKC